MIKLSVPGVCVQPVGRAMLVFRAQNSHVAGVVSGRVRMVATNCTVAGAAAAAAAVVAAVGSQPSN